MSVFYLWIAAWWIFYFVGLKVDLVPLLGNQGFRLIDGQYYRFFTGLMLHVNLFHVLINSVAMYWTGVFLKGQVSKTKLLIFSAAAGTAANLVFSAIYPESISIGGSPVIFALIGLLFALQLFRADVPRFQPKTTYGSWIIGYAILGNIPIFSGNISTLVIHLTAFAVAFLLGMAGIKWDLI